MNYRIDSREAFEFQLQWARTLIQTRTLLHRARTIANDARQELKRAPPFAAHRLPDHEDRSKALL